MLAWYVMSIRMLAWYRRVTLFLLAQQRQRGICNNDSQLEASINKVVGKDVRDQVFGFVHNELFSLFNALPDTATRARILGFQDHRSMQREMHTFAELQPYLSSKGVEVEHRYSGGDHYHVLEIAWYNKNTSNLNWAHFREMASLTNLDLDKNELTKVDLTQLSNLRHLKKLSFCNNPLEGIIDFSDLPIGLKTLWLDVGMLDEYHDSMLVERHYAISNVFVINNEAYHIHVRTKMLEVPFSFTDIESMDLFDEGLKGHTLKRLDFFSLFNILPNAEVRRRVLGFESYVEMFYNINLEYFFGIDAHFQSKGISYEVRDEELRITRIDWYEENITDVNWRHIRELTYLRFLNLDENLLTQVGLIHLSNLEYFTMFSCCGNAVAGIIDLGLLPKGLECLWIDDNIGCGFQERQLPSTVIMVGFQDMPPALETLTVRQSGFQGQFNLAECPESLQMMILEGNFFDITVNSSVLRQPREMVNVLSNQFGRNNVTFDGYLMDNELIPNWIQFKSEERFDSDL